MDIHQMVCEISQRVDEMTIDAFAICGFREDFIIENIKDFYVSQNVFNGDKSYFYKDKLLFTVRTKIEDCGLKSVVYVDFAKEYEGLLNDAIKDIIREESQKEPIKI